MAHSEIRFGRAAALATLAALTLASAADAATVSIDEIALDGVFSQASFGEDPVDVRVAPTREIRDRGLANVGRRGRRIGAFRHRGRHESGNRADLRRQHRVVFGL